jgi:hypothetical protein
MTYRYLTLMMLTAQYMNVMRRLNTWRESINDLGARDAFRGGGWPSLYPLQVVGSVNGASRKMVVLNRKETGGDH